MLSAVLIIPASLRAKANALGAAMGWGPNNYSIELSPTGNAPVTHYGARASVTGEFIAMMQDASQGNLPSIDFPPADFGAVLGSLVADFRADMTGHFADVLESHGLQMVEPSL